MLTFWGDYDVESGFGSPGFVVFGPNVRMGRNDTNTENRD